MNRRLLLATVLVSVFSFYSRAQKNPVIINSGEIIAKGIEYFENQNYEDAIDEFQKVDRNDTNYVLARYEEGYSWYKHEEYDSAIAIARELIAREDYHSADAYSLLGNALDDAKRNKEAVELYKSAIQKFPKSYLLNYNLGLSHYRAKNFDAAYSSLKNALALNPRHPASHFILGILMAEKKRWAPAMLAMHMTLLLGPNEVLENNCRSLLISIAKGEYVLDTAIVKFSEAADPGFSKSDKLIESKVALNSQYEVVTKLDDKLMKQTQFLLESLKQNKPDKKNYYAQQYIDFYTDLQTAGHLKTFLYYPYKNLDNEIVTKWKSKSRKDIESFENFIGEQFSRISAEYTDTVNGYPHKFKRFFYRNGNIHSLGTDYEPAGEIRKGYWRLYGANTRLEFEGKYDASGKMQGEWKRYYDSGKLRYTANYKDGKLDGIFIEYHPNGNPKKEAIFKDGLYNGLVKYYYISGALKSEENYKAGLLDGKLKTYYSNGNPTLDLDAKNDKMDGKILRYEKRGYLSSKTDTKNGEKDGMYEEYFPNGKIKEKGAIKLGKAEGKWITYNEDGKVIQECEFSGGELTGTFKKYHNNGTLAGDDRYEKGKIISELDYDKDGKKFFEGSYKNGILVAYKYYDKSGKIVHDATESKGELDFMGYFPDGKLSFKGKYKKGEREGEWIYYYWNGAVREKEQYEKGILIGEFTVYHKNGNVKKQGTYKDNEMSGYCRTYYENGRTDEEYNVAGGYREGNSYSYYPDGSLYKHNYYREGDEVGWQSVYFPDGKLNYEYLLNEVCLEKYIVYDTMGKPFHSYSNPTGTAPYEFKYFNGKTEQTGTYKNGYSAGVQKVYFSNGNLKYEINYIKNYKDGVLKEYFRDGKLAKEGFYRMGEADSIWSFYEESGKLDVRGRYKNDERYGIWTWYYPNSKVEYLTKYNGEDKDSLVTLLAPDGSVRIKIRYDDGVIMGYIYQDKDGKDLPENELVNETGTVVAYYANGNKSYEGKYVNGSREGKFMYYYPDGKVQWEKNYLKGWATGKQLFYFDNGKLEKEENQLYDEYDGTWKLYDKAGNLLEERNYKLGYLHGPVKIYEGGKLKKESAYYYGIETSVK